MLLVKLKETIGDLQAKNVHFQTQIEKLEMKNNKLTSENKQLNILNENLTIEVNFLKESLERSNLKLVY